MLALLALFQLAASEMDVLRELEAARVEAMARHLSETVAQSPSGAGFGSAIAGSPEERALADVIALELDRLGLEVRRERFPVRAFDYGEVVLEGNGRRIPAITLHSGGGTFGSWDGIPFQRGNRGEGKTLVAPLVDAGRGMAADYDARGDVEGAAVLVEWTSWPGFAIFEAAARGASAVIFHDYPGRSLDDALKQNTVIYHDAVPSVSISVADASALKRQLSGGPVEIELTNRVEATLGFSENVMGILPGSVVPDELVAVTSHHDRWFRGAQDDAIGVAVVLEIARVMTQLSTPPRRTHLFLSFGSEETGGADVEVDWLRGSHAFVEAHPEMTSRLAYAFNVDGAGWPAERGYLYGTLEASSFHRKLLEDAGLAGRVTLKRGVTDWVDAWTLAAVGGASAGYLLWFEAHGLDGPDAFSPYYHTQHDRIALAPYENLEHDLTLAALSLMRVDAAENLPFGLDEVARFVIEELENIRSEGILLDAVEQAEGWARKLETTEVVGGRDDWRTANRRLMRARRELIPWLVSLSASGAVARTTPYLDDFLAARRARESAERGDGAAARTALAEVSTMSWGKELSRSAYRAERLMSYSRPDWSRAFDQSPRPVAPDVWELYQSLESGSTVPEGLAARLGEIETEALGRCREALFLITGKLEKAVALLEGESVLGAAPLSRAR